MDMFWHMLDENNHENQHVRDEFKRWNLSIEKHGKIIADLIMGKPDENCPERGFLYEVCYSLRCSHAVMHEIL